MKNTIRRAHARLSRTHDRAEEYYHAETRPSVPRRGAYGAALTYSASQTRVGAHRTGNRELSALQSMSYHSHS